MSKDLGKLIEALALAWLNASDTGRLLGSAMSTDDAIDAVFELLNAGFLKIAVDRRRKPTGFTFSLTPRPPTQPIQRPSKQIH